MNGTIHHDSFVFHCKLELRVLAYTWIFALILGAGLAVSADKLLASTMHAAISGCVSISGLLAVVLLPLLLSAYAVYYSQPFLLVSVVFLKAFLFAYTGAGILILYPASGWLIQMLLMFCDTLSLPFLWHIWLCAVSDWQGSILARITTSAFVSVLIGCVDLTLIAPFLARLI